MQSVFKAVFLVALIAVETIRAPHRARVSRERRKGGIAVSRVRGLEAVLMTLSFFGLYLFPLFYIFSPWLDFANYNLPDASGIPGTVLVVAAVYIVWRAHADLGRNWSPSLEIVQNQSLITSGVYSLVRHPIYSAMILFALAQALLLHNWIAGLGGLIVYLPLFLLRVPREEAMMIETFGQEYRDYMARTGRFFPKRLG